MNRKVRKGESQITKVAELASSELLCFDLGAIARPERLSTWDSLFFSALATSLDLPSLPLSTSYSTITRRQQLQLRQRSRLLLIFNFLQVQVNATSSSIGTHSLSRRTDLLVVIIAHRQHVCRTTLQRRQCRENLQGSSCAIICTSQSTCRLCLSFHVELHKLAPVMCRRAPPWSWVASSSFPSRMLYLDSS
jgi:hypothetical protein